MTPALTIKKYLWPIAKILYAQKSNNVSRHALWAARGDGAILRPIDDNLVHRSPDPVLRFPISPFFVLSEALYLPTLRCYHFPTILELWNIILLANKLTLLRARILNVPIIVHSWIRPAKTHCLDFPNAHGVDYNFLVTGKNVKKRSAHIPGKAVDFHVRGFQSAEDCQQIRERILQEDYLKRMKLRMENCYGNWIHIDNAGIGYFTP